MSHGKLSNPLVMDRNPTKLRSRKVDRHIADAEEDSHSPITADRFRLLDVQLGKSIRSSTSSASSILHSSAISNILTLYHNVRKRQRLRQLIALGTAGAMLIGVLWFFLFSDSTLALAVIRKLLITILPWWDWTTNTKTRCLIQNPVPPEIVQSDENCIICEDLKWIREFDSPNVTAFQIGEDFLVEDLPVIIRNAVEASGREQLRLRSLLQMHLHDDFMEPCKFRTNLKTKRAFQFRSFLEKVNRDDLTLPWFAYWEFCKTEHVKEARPVVPRPDIIPTMLEITGSVWFFLSANFTSHSFKRIELSKPVLWFVQISGTSRVQLIPRGLCGDICSRLQTELEPGDLILVTDSLFAFEWMPGDSGEVLAVAAGAQ